MAFPNQSADIYNDTVVRQFAIMTVVWGVVGMLVGVIIAANWHGRNSILEYLGSAMGACGPCTPMQSSLLLVVAACLPLPTMWRSAPAR